jgi:hypothetical protein
VKRVSLALTLLTFASCGDSGSDARPGVERVCGPDIETTPCGDGVEAGVPYRFELLTHCGVVWAYLDGRYWIASPKIDPPPDWSPVESGTVTLVGEQQVRFEGDSGGQASFRPAPHAYEPPPCA